MESGRQAALSGRAAWSLFPQRLYTGLAATRSVPMHQKKYMRRRDVLPIIR